MYKATRCGRIQRSGSWLALVWAFAIVGLPLTAQGERAPKITHFKFGEGKQEIIFWADGGKLDWEYELFILPIAPAPAPGVAVSLDHAADGKRDHRWGGDTWKITPIRPPAAKGDKYLISMWVWNDNFPGGDNRGPLELIVKNPDRSVADLIYEQVAIPEVNLDRPGDQPDSDPGQAITDPTGPWHELWPKHCSDWNCLDWIDNDTQILDISDYLYMERIDSGMKQWYHVEFVTITITVSEKPGLVETSYLDYMGLDISWTLLSPIGTMWYEVHPNESQLLNCTGWTDDPMNPDGRLSASDQIVLTDKDTGVQKEYHVDAVSTDIEIIPEIPSNIPAVSEWGLVVMTLLVLVGATVVIARRRAREVSA